MPGGIFAEIAEFERKLGLPLGFYEQLLQGDDWSFVVKLNALFEAASTHVLAERLHAQQLVGALAQLDFANTKYGKVALLRELGAVSSEQAGVLRALAELRNLVVHNVANVNFTFSAHVAALDANQRKLFVKVFGRGVKEHVEVAGKRIANAKFVQENPKLAVWFTAAEVLACMYLEFEVAALSLRRLALSEFERLRALTPITFRGKS